MAIAIQHYIKLTIEALYPCEYVEDSQSKKLIMTRDKVCCFCDTCREWHHECIVNASLGRSVGISSDSIKIMTFVCCGQNARQAEKCIAHPDQQVVYQRRDLS